MLNNSGSNTAINSLFNVHALAVLETTAATDADHKIWLIIILEPRSTAYWLHLNTSSCSGNRHDTTALRRQYSRRPLCTSYYIFLECRDTSLLTTRTLLLNISMDGKLVPLQPFLPNISSTTPFTIWVPPAQNQTVERVFHLLSAVINYAVCYLACTLC